MVGRGGAGAGAVVMYGSKEVRVGKGGTTLLVAPGTTMIWKSIKSYAPGTPSNIVTVVVPNAWSREVVTCKVRALLLTVIQFGVEFDGTTRSPGLLRYGVRSTVSNSPRVT